MGIVGSIRNFGKVAGPIFIGALLEKLAYQSVFQIIGITNILVVLFIIMIFIFSSMIKKKN